MVSFNDVQAQLIKLNSQFRFIGIGELKQLSYALQPGEQIFDCLKGWHKGTIAVICATDQRMIIVDKRTTKANLQYWDIAYEAIDSLTHADRVWNAQLQVKTDETMYEFVSWHITRLKQLHAFIGRHISYVKERNEAAQALVNKVHFQTSVRPATTSRNWAVFARRIGNSSLS
jgi:hypothetical protein